jgi:hypothetical protein
MMSAMRTCAVLACAWLMASTSAIAESQAVYAISVQPERLILLDLESRRDGPDRPVVTMIVINPEPTLIDGRQFQRIDMSVRFDCRARTTQILDSAIRTIDGTLLFQRPMNEPAHPILAGAHPAVAEPLVCRNEVSPMLEGRVGTLAQHQRVYFRMLQQSAPE